MSYEDLVDEVKVYPFHKQLNPNSFKQLTGENLIEEKIKPKMKAIARSVMIASQNKVTARKNSCAIYGFDFMIDSNYNV